MYFVFYGLHDTTLQICIISLYECFAYDITVVVKINLFQCQCQYVNYSCTHMLGGGGRVQGHMRAPMTKF